MNFTHIKLKSTKKINTNFSINDAETPEVNKKLSNNIYKENKLFDELGFDLAVKIDNSMINAFDYLNGKQRIIIPELNPTTIFYLNAIMFHKNLIVAKKALLENSPTLRNLNKPIDSKIFGFYFQFATNCLINLQSAIESFVNRQIPENYFINENNEEYEVSIFYKIDTVLPKIKDKKFKTKAKQDNLRVREIIELRNKIIHLKPSKEDTNTQYKDIYRKMIKFDFTKAIVAVRNFINFYEPELIEECPCGKEYYFEVEINEKQ